MKSKKNKKATTYPKRIQSHRTDTLAVRRLMSTLSADWVIREMTDRDYGIDVMFEYFRNDQPTGLVVLGQVKGTKKSLGKSQPYISFPLPKKTLAYSELFSVPFFLFLVQPVTGKIWYLWLQKYISTRLDKETSGWRTDKRKSLSVVIPSTNTLVGNENRIVRMAEYPIFLHQALQFLSAHQWWELQFPYIAQKPNEFARLCLDQLKRITRLHCVLKHQEQFLPLSDIERGIGALQKIASGKATRIPKELSNLDEALDAVKTGILQADDIEQFVMEMTDEAPY